MEFGALILKFGGLVSQKHIRFVQLNVTKDWVISEVAKSIGHLSVN